MCVGSEVLVYLPPSTNVIETFVSWRVANEIVILVVRTHQLFRQAPKELATDITSVSFEA
jgi:hypothetical protein